MLTFLYCTFEGPQTEEFWGHITLNVAYCVWHGNYWLKYWWKPNENIKDKGWGHVGWSEYQLQTVLYVCFCVCVRTHMCVCTWLFILGQVGNEGALAVRWLVVVSVLLGQRRPGLLHLLSFLSAPAATALGRINHHTELLAQVCHLIWKMRATKSF